MDRESRIPTVAFRIAALASACILSSCGSPKPIASEQSNVASGSSATEASAAKEKEALETGVQAVVYGLPLVIMDITMKKGTNVKRPGNFNAPVNQFAHVREFPTAAFKDVVRANVDTLYSSAFLDLANEPMVFSVPDTHGRYYLLPMIDAWTNIFASPGKRTTGTKPGNFAITGPGWTGALPAELQQLKSPTNMVDHRTHADQRTEGLSRGVRHTGRLQARSTLRFWQALHAAARQRGPEHRYEDSTVEQLQKVSSGNFFAALARLLKSNPPPASDAHILAKLATIGVVLAKDLMLPSSIRRSPKHWTRHYRWRFRSCRRGHSSQAHQ